MNNKVSVFNNLTSTKAVAKVEIKECLNAIKQGGKHLNNVIKVRSGEVELKKKIPVVTWNGVFSKRSNGSVVSFSDHIYLDFDNVDSDTKSNISRIECVTAVWESVSGNGLGCLVKSKGVNKKNFKSTILSIIEYFEERDIYPDKLTDIARCNVLSYDPDMYYNDQAEVFNTVEPVIKQPEYSNLMIENSYYHTACNISLAYTYKKGLTFIPGYRHNFTITYFGLCNQFGIPLDYAYNYAVENGCVSNVTYSKAQKLYRTWSNQHGIKQVYGDYN